MPKTIGQKELQRRAFREALAVPGRTRRAAQTSNPTELSGTIEVGDKVTGGPFGAGGATIVATSSQESKLKKSKSTKSAAKRKPAAKAKTAKPSKPKAAAKRKGVPATEVAEMLCRPVGHPDAPLGGASMKELEKKFKIEAHPMRAKIHYIRHELGYSVETKDGRYFGTAPAKTEAEAV